MNRTSEPQGTKNLSDYVKIVERDSPLVLTMPHSGRIYEGIPHHLDLSREDVKRTIITGIDYSVPEVTQVHSFDDATVIWTDLARVIVDVNRGREDYDRYSVEGGLSYPKSQGVVWNATFERKEEDLKRLLTHPYTKEEFEYLMSIGYDPFVNAVRYAMAKAQEKYGIAVLFDMHSIWTHINSTVESGQFAGAYVIGRSAEPGPSIDGKIPNLILMNSEGTSCSQELTDYILNHFTNNDLTIEQRAVASSRYQLAHQKYSELGEVFSMEIVGHKGIEKDRADGKILFEPDQEYLKQLQANFYTFLVGLSNLEFQKSVS